MFTYLVHHIKVKYASRIEQVNIYVVLVPRIKRKKHKNKAINSNTIAPTVSPTHLTAE